MRRHHGKKVDRSGHHKAKKAKKSKKPKIALKRLAFKGFDNTKDIELILSKRKLVQDLLGFSGEKLGMLFEKSIMLLQQNRNEEAVKAFELLTQFNPYVADFWLGLGIAKYVLEEYKPALLAILVAQTMDPSRAEPYLYAIDCCLELKDFQQAQSIIDQGFKYAKKHVKQADSQLLLKELPLRLELATETGSSL
ncbi:MAG: scc3-C [Chlamydiia bacterium]|nr:scc3-C [Chlamydiia bacterium]